MVRRNGQERPAAHFVSRCDLEKQCRPLASLSTDTIAAGPRSGTRACSPRTTRGGRAGWRSERRPRRAASWLFLLCLLGLRIDHHRACVGAGREVAGGRRAVAVGADRTRRNGVRRDGGIDARDRRRGAPSTCESTETVMLVRGVLWKLTVSPTYGLSEQVAVLPTVTCLSFASTWYPAVTVSCTV